MPKEKLDLEKVTLRLFKGDRERVQKFFPGVDYNVAIRNIISKTLKGLEEKESKGG